MFYSNLSNSWGLFAFQQDCAVKILMHFSTTFKKDLTKCLNNKTVQMQMAVLFQSQEKK